jgi:hypothetical protein
MKTPKFKVGQVVMWESSKKSVPIVIKEVIEQGDGFFYRFDKTNALHESMVRTLTPQEAYGSPNGPLRMYMALKILRAWNSGTAGFDALVVGTIHQWIDDGDMQLPIPWPRSPFFEEWAEKHGYANIDGHVGFRLVGQRPEVSHASETRP